MTAKQHAQEERERYRRRLLLDAPAARRMVALQTRRTYYAKRAEAFARLGNRCAACGCNVIEALHIDHVHNGGTRCRSNSYSLFKRVLEDRSDTYQLLCANCNWLKQLSRHVAGTSATTRRRARVYAEILTQLGGTCAGCGCSDSRVLQIDHKDGGGCRARRRHTGPAYYYKISRDLQAGSTNYQLLCANCNWIKRRSCAGENTLRKYAEAA